MKRRMAISSNDANRKCSSSAPVGRDSTLAGRSLKGRFDRLKELRYRGIARVQKIAPLSVAGQSSVRHSDIGAYHVLTSASLSRDPLTDVCCAIHQCDAIRLAALEKADGLLTC